MSVIMSKSKDRYGYVSEVFFSIQGEGPWAGKPQWFIRLAGCKQRCRYCDTPHAQAYTPEKWNFRPRLTGSGRQYNNPVLPAQIIGKILLAADSTRRIPSVAITGGEPLEQPLFVDALITGLRKNINKVEILLETNGLEYNYIVKHQRQINYISVDIKLASVSGLKATMLKHRRFLQKIATPHGCIKIVVGSKTSMTELEKAFILARKIKPDWELVLQPISDKTGPNLLGRNMLAKILDKAVAIHPHVRIIPQLHRCLGVL
ncbi:7-carboxy-7-deazaguanine synthase QueE [candidate division FCPU426 bacterium]|nr:7-carboxy-7-deazaguanine synthase QueE [candidate division FCPU426 bacterium]